MRNASIMLEAHPIKGIYFSIAAYFFVSLIGICVKSMSTAVPLMLILFYQNLICLGLTLPTVLKSGIGDLKTNQIKDYAIRILSGICCSLSLFYAIRFISVSEAMLYQYSAPLWIPLIMLVWFNVRMPKNLWYGIVLGFIGIIFILKPDAPGLQLISIVGILCGIFQGISVVAVRKLSLTEPTSRILFYNFLIVTLITLPFVLTNDAALLFKDYLLLCCIGLTTYFGQKFFAISFQYANATTLAPTCYMAILFSGLFAWLFWREIPEGITLLGMFLVISGCLLSMAMSKRNVNPMAEVNTQTQSNEQLIETEKV